MLTATVLNFNGKDIIRKCVDAVAKNRVDEILVIDNNSTDSSWKLVESDVTDVIHANNKHQFITGLNVSFESAKDGKVVFLENDVLPHKNCFKEMAESGADIVSPQFYDKDGFKYKVEWFTGFLSACFMMEKSTFEFVGEFDKKLAPAYWEDVDYSIRARRMGFKTKKGVGRAIHHANWSFSKVFTKPQMSGWCRRNALYLLNKHFLRRFNHVSPS